MADPLASESRRHCRALLSELEVKKLVLFAMDLIFVESI